MRQISRTRGVDNLFGEQQARSEDTGTRATRSAHLRRVAATALPLLCAASVEFAYSPADAATISWGTPTAISSDSSDVQDTGTLVYAYNMGSDDVTGNNKNSVTTVTINGVVFAKFDCSDADNGGETATHGNVSISGIDPSFDGAGSEPATGSGGSAVTSATISSSYGAMLGQVVFTASNTNLVVTLSGLTQGNQYCLELWVSDARASITGSEVANDNAGDSSSAFRINASGTTGGTGNYIIGTFTADGTDQQVVNLVQASSAELDGLSLFNVTPAPEPATLGLAGFALGAVALRRRRRQ